MFPLDVVLPYPPRLVVLDLFVRRGRPQETFHIYDDALVSVELLSARVRVTQPGEIALYLRAFDQLRQMAVYGQTARALVVKAIDVLP